MKTSRRRQAEESGPLLRTVLGVSENWCFRPGVERVISVTSSWGGTLSFFRALVHGDRLKPICFLGGVGGGSINSWSASNTILNCPSYFLSSSATLRFRSRLP